MTTNANINLFNKILNHQKTLKIKKKIYSF